MTNAKITVGAIIKTSNGYMMVQKIIRKKVAFSQVLEPIGFVARGALHDMSERPDLRTFSHTEKTYQVLSSKEERAEAIKETVRRTHEVVLSSFREYESLEALRQAEQDNLSEDAWLENPEEDPSVFRAFDVWLFSDDWHDVEWD